MALSASGLGSGLDINSLVSQLMAVERQPLTAMARKEASFQAKLSAFGQIKGSLSALQTAANALNDAAKFSATKATVGSDAGFTASTASGAARASAPAPIFFSAMRRATLAAIMRRIVRPPAPLCRRYGAIRTIHARPACVRRRT